MWNLCLIINNYLIDKKNIRNLFFQETGSLNAPLY